jgi:hypothetical protein
MALVLKPLWLAALAVLVLAACTSGSTASTPSPSPSGSPSPTARAADSKASDLRTKLNLLLGEHSMLVAKQAVAASNHTDEYSGYLTLLGSNTNSLVDVIRSAYGNTAANQFGAAWGVQNMYLVDYTIGVVTHNDAKANGASSGLLNGFTPQFAQLLASLAQLQIDSVTQLETAQLDAFKAVVDDESAQSYVKLYADVRLAHGHSSRIADMLALRMAQQFPDKFPGDPTINAVEARITLNDLLQEDSYLTTMVSEAGIAGRGDEAAAALGGVAGVRADLTPVIGFLLGPDGRAGFPGIWGIRDADLFGYANSSDAGARQRLTGSFVSQFSALTHAPAAAIRDQVVATLKVMDDQRAKASKNIAGDDRSAAAAMQSIADAI